MAASVAAVLLLLTAGAAGRVASAVEERYSLGSVQPDRELHVAGTGVVTTSVLLYNIDGTVPTDVELAVVQAPAGWNVTLEPVTSRGSGAQVLSLQVAPSVVRPAPVSCPGEVCLPPRGYVCADVVLVRIEVPSVRSGTSGEVRVQAIASWPSGGVASPFPQEREFVFYVSTAAETADATPASRRSGPSTPLSVAAVGALALAGALVWRRALVKSGRLA